VGLLMCQGDSGDDPIEETKQLYLSHMFGHKNSNLLVWPIAPAVNKINHKSGVSANAKMRWSAFLVDSNNQDTLIDI